MKKLIFIFTMLLTVWAAGAVPVLVSGNVSNVNTGAPVAEQNVWVLDSISGIFATTLTDLSGHYELQIEMADPNQAVLVSTSDMCNNIYIQVVQPSLDPVAGYAVYADFEVEDCIPTDCSVWASYSLEPGNTASFYANAWSWTDSSAVFTYTWDFGDGTSGTGEAPSHTYAQQGTYVVSVTATSADCEVVFSLVVVVEEVTTVTVSGNITYPSGAGVPFWFVDVEGNGIYFSINTDQNGNYSEQISVPASLTYLTISTYTFCNPFGYESLDVPIVNQAATANFVLCDSFPGPQECSAYMTYYQTGDFTFQFEANAFSNSGSPFIGYIWDFGDGNTSEEANPEHTYAAPGLYTVFLTATTEDGCIVHACDLVFAFGDSTWCPIDTFYYGCQAMFISEYAISPIGSWDPLTLSFQSISFGAVVSWTWNFGDGTVETGTPVTSHTYATEGQYTVTLSIVTADGCESTFTMVVFAGDFPWIEPDCQALFIPLPDSTGNGFFFLDLSFSPAPIQSWTWDFGDGTTSSEQNPFHEYAVGGVYTVTLNIEADSCNSVISFEINTDNPFNKFAGNGTFGLTPNVSGTNSPVSLSKAKIAPNPVSNRINLAFESQTAQAVRISVVNMTGQEVHSVNTEATTGWNAVQIPAEDLAPGAYFLQIQGGKEVQTIKLVKSNR